MACAASIKDRLIAETEKLAHRQGFAATSINDVLAVAGVTKGALYHHFPGKGDLELAVLEQAGNAFLKWLDDVLVGPTPRDALDLFLDSAFKHHRKERFIGGCLFGNAALEMSDVSRPHKDCVERIFSQWSKKVEAVVSVGQTAGQIRNDIPAAALADFVVASLEGGIMLSRLRKKERPLRTCIESLKTFLAIRGQ